MWNGFRWFATNSLLSNYFSMQRAFDQLIHDMCFMDLAVTILGVRSTFAGLDSPTHHGISIFLI